MLAITDEPPVTAGDIGCWVAGSGFNTAAEINAQTVELAERYGLPVSDDISAAIGRLAAGAETADDWQWLSEAADDAVEWLNDKVVPPGHYFTFDDGLMMYSSEEGDEL